MSNPCPDCGRERGTEQVHLGRDRFGAAVLSPERPSRWCEPCHIGIDPDSEWPRPMRPEFQGLPLTACGFAILPNGKLIPPRELY
ncbi:hypothetical protein [Agromyces sp. NBRC 114283]|uniref:hypothetical protein n=1 Tax=Agromyces sp. NBRC 114283 TaxID=2994521 RepID=UPI002552A418|nr:hypothetical protein [Agromyces sp. NBRC 114283]